MIAAWARLTVGFLAAAVLIESRGGDGFAIDVQPTAAGLVIGCQIKPVTPDDRQLPIVYPPQFYLESSTNLADWAWYRAIMDGILRGPPVHKQVTLPLPIEPQRFYRVHRQWNLVEAQLADGNFSDLDFAGADLYQADLRFANLRNADLRLAELRAANLFGADLTGARVDGAWLPDPDQALEEPDAEVLALEISGELLPPSALYSRLAADIGAIRRAFPDLNHLHHFKRWRLGFLVINASEDTIEAILAGAVQPAPYALTRNVFSPDLLRFPKRYNPEALARIYNASLGVGSVEPEFAGGDGSRIGFDEKTGEYSFTLAWGDCPAGCGIQHLWVFTVQDNQVTLVRESGDPPPPGWPAQWPP